MSSETSAKKRRRRTTPRSTKAQYADKLARVAALLRQDMCATSIAMETDTPKGNMSHIIRDCGYAKMYVTPEERVHVMAMRLKNKWRRA